MSSRLTDTRHRASSVITAVRLVSCLCDTRPYLVWRVLRLLISCDAPYEVLYEVYYVTRLIWCDTPDDNSRATPYGISCDPLYTVFYPSLSHAIRLNWYWYDVPSFDTPYLVRHASLSRAVRLMIYHGTHALSPVTHSLVSCT